MADPTYKSASENLAIVLTDLGTSLKLSGHVQEGLAKYYDALKADSRYAVSRAYFIPAWAFFFLSDVALTWINVLERNYWNDDVTGWDKS